MKITISFIILLFILNGISIAVEDQQYSNFVEVAPGIYAGKRLIGQEMVHFAMERIEEDNELQWITYRRSAMALTQWGRRINARGLLLNCIEFSSLGKQYECEQRSGFSKQEYNDFINKLNNVVQDYKEVPVYRMYEDHLFVDQVKKPEKTKSIVNAIPAVCDGAGGFMEDAFSGNCEYILSHERNKKYFATYASKKPITGKFPFKLPTIEIRKPYPDITLKEHYQYFEDIIMTVGSTFENGKDWFENRGKFKNPISFIEDRGKYPNLSLLLSSFSACVSKHICNDIQRMIVSPQPVMRSIFFKGILEQRKYKRGDLLINEKDVEDYDLEAINQFKDGQFFTAGRPEVPLSIKTSVLIEFYTNP